MLSVMKLIRLLPLIAVLLLAACSCSEDAATNGSVLKRGLSTEPESLDVHKARSIQAADVLRDLGEGLLAYSANGELVPAAATHWEVSDCLLYTSPSPRDA